MNIRSCLLAIVIGILYSLNGWSQGAGVKRLDALSIDIEHSTHDTDLVKALNRSAYLLSRTDPQKGIEYSKIAITLSEQLNYDRGLAKALDNCALCNNVTGDTAVARSCANRSLTIAQKINDTACQVLALTRLGYITFWAKRQRQQARAYGEQALRLAQATNNKESLAFAYMHMGFLLNKKKDISIAIKYDSLAIGLFDSLNDGYSKAGSLCNLGIEYYVLKDRKREIEIDSIALKLLAPYGNTEYKAITLVCLSDCYYKQHHYEQALTPYLEALAIDTRLGKKVQMADDNARAAMALYKLQQYSAAAKHINAALAIEHTLNDPLLFWYYSRIKKKIEKHLYAS